MSKHPAIRPEDICPVAGKGHHYIMDWQGKERYFGTCKFCGVEKDFDPTLGVDRNLSRMAKINVRKKEEANAATDDGV